MRICSMCFILLVDAFSEDSASTAFFREYKAVMASEFMQRVGLHH
jgi:hypothetical protein